MRASITFSYYPVASRSSPAYTSLFPIPRVILIRHMLPRNYPVVFCFNFPSGFLYPYLSLVHCDPRVLPPISLPYRTFLLKGGKGEHW